MLEGLAAKILQNYIGKYVNVNANKLSVGLLTGVVELDNLPLKPEAFNDHDLPFELKFGYLEKVKLNISLNSLRYAPLLLTADNLFIIIGPKNKDTSKKSTENLENEKNDSNYGDELNAQENNQNNDNSEKLQNEKLERLTSLENKWFKEVEFLGVTSGASNAEDQTSYFSMLGTLAYLLKNIHVNLNRIHIKYEDNNFSIGTYIESICIKNSDTTDLTNETNQEASNTLDNKNLTKKSCEVNKFSIYTDTKTIYKEENTKEEIINLMNFEKLTNESTTLKYIIKPTSLMAQVTRDMSLQPLRKRNKPRIRVSSNLKEFHLHIDEEQIKYISNIVRLTNIHSNTSEIVRPASLSIKMPKDSTVEDRKKLVRSWWFYAIECVQRKLRKPDRKHLIKWSCDINSYRKIYEKILINRFNQTLFPINNTENSNNQLESIDNLPNSLNQEKQRIETEWSLDQLKLTRRVIFEKIVKNPIFKEYFVKLKQNNSLNQTDSTSSSNYRMYNYISWSMTNLKGYYYGTSEPSKAEENLAITDQTSPSDQYNQIDDEVLALISDSIENDSLLRRDSFLACLTFILDSASIVIASNNVDIAELKFERSTLNFDALPRHDSFLFALKLGSFYLNDCISMNNTTIRKNYFPRIIYPKNSNQEISFHVFELTYEHNPLQNTKSGSKHTGNLIVKSGGLDIIYNVDVLENIKKFFQNSLKHYIRAKRILIRRTKKRTETEIKLNSSYHNSIIHKINFNFEITAPKVIFPQDFYTKNPLVVVFDFGRLALMNRNSNSNLSLVKSTKKSNSTNDNNLATLKKSKTDANFERSNMYHIERINNSNSTEDLNEFDSKQRRNSEGISFKIGEPNISDNEDDDIFVTPSSTPTNEKMEKAVLNMSEGNFENNLYSIYDLHLNNLQTIIGKYDNENLQIYLNRGQSNLHFLEKFDISIQIDIFKLKQNKLVENRFTPLKVDVKLNLLKLHIDDLKLTYIYKTLENLQKIFLTNNIKNDPEYLDNEHFQSTYPSEFLDDADSTCFWTDKNLEFNSSLSTYINLDIDEIDMTMSIAGIKDDFGKSLEMIMKRKSICELRIFNVNSEFLKSQNANQLVRLKIFGLLLIDARQIYGTDYQLLAASHSQIELDSKTGRITERTFNNLKQQQSEDEEDKLNPLIKMNLVIIDNKDSNRKEYILKSSFSMLDIVLNPETISEIILLFYSSYLNITSSSKGTESKVGKETEEVLELNVKKPLNRMKISFEFTRLSVLLFRIESFEKAKKIALFEMNGTSVQATILPEINYLEVISKIKGLKISDLKQAVKVDANHKSIFGIGLQTESDSQVFEIVYKKSEDENKNCKLEVSELRIQMASLCYLHSPEFIYEIQCCFNDFSRFQAKVIKELSEKAASLAIDLYNKGKTYIEDTIADIYQQVENEKLLDNKFTSATKRTSPLKVNIYLETPVIAIPMCADSNQLIIAHLGNIEINNGPNCMEVNSKIRKYDPFKSSSRNVTTKSMNENLDQVSDESSSDLEKEIFERTISDSTKFKVDLKSMNLFTVDLEKEKNKKTNFTTNLLSNEKYFIENNFQIYYKPMYSDKLINETDVILNLDYMPKLKTNSSEKKANVKINRGYLRAILKINTCQIILSKVQMEQFIKTLDNIVYDDSKIKQSDLRPIDSMSLSETIVSDIPDTDLLIYDDDDDKSDFFQYNPEIMQSMSTPKFNSSSFKTLYSNFSEKNEDLKSDLSLNVKFKIEKLSINFLADVERPSQDIAELCFNEYELSILRHEKHVKFFDMTLKSLTLSDKLKVSPNSSKMKSNEKFEDNTNYLLKSSTSYRGANLKHTCRRRKKNSEYLSRSTPNINFTRHKRFRYETYHQTKSKTSYKLNDFDQYNDLSTSLPPEMASVSYKTTRRVSRVSENYDSRENSGCPSTPPPSPTKKMLNPLFLLKKSESMSKLSDSDETGSTDESDFVNLKIKNRKKINCQACELQNSPMVSIKLIFIDKNHPKIKTKFSDFNRFYKVKFADLQLNVNPETWIILLDMLGLGAKIYQETEEIDQTLTSNEKNFLNNKKIHVPLIPDQGKESHQSTSIEFEVKHFSIQLNKSSDISSKLAKFKVNNVLTFIESRYDFMKANGKLGSLGIYDVSPSRGLYIEKFLTSGKKALDFEFFKHNGPPDIYCCREFDNAFKLRMSSVKYIHTQRFLSELTNYFQQFNQLQDTLSRMRALSLGQGNINYAPQRSSRVKLDIQTQTPIIVIPVHSDSADVLIFNLGNINVENTFLRAGEEGTLSFIKQINEQQEPQKTCLLDKIQIQFTDTNLYSAVRFKRMSNKANEQIHDDNPEFFTSDPDEVNERSKVEFNSFIFRQQSANILEKKSYLSLRLERNLETSISHSSPDWVIYAKLDSFLFSIDLKQYILVRGILDHNIGEKLSQDNSQPTFIMPNTKIETVLTGEVWKCICINLDLENVGIKLLNNTPLNSNDCDVNLERAPLAHLAFLKSSLIYESFSDQNKLIDLVSSEILIMDISNAKTKSNTNNISNIFTNILCNPDPKKPSDSVKRLQLELHYRSNKTYNRYSILINNCRVIAVLDWLIKVKNFISSNYECEKMSMRSAENFYRRENTKPPINQQQQVQQPIEIKLNLTNTDLVMVEKTNDKNSQAVILRLTAFIEYNQRKANRPFESCLQSVELFSCQMNAIKETALSIIDPVTFNIYLSAKNHKDENEFQNGSNISPKKADTDFLLDISTDILKLRFSYLDFKLFLRLIDSINKQFQVTKKEKNENKISHEKDDTNQNEIETAKPKTKFAQSVHLNMSNFCICIIDDCKDVDIPLTDIQFDRIKLVHYFGNEFRSDSSDLGTNTAEQGSAEFGLNVDYYNRLLSGWEPLVEPWLARLNWRFKSNQNSFTLTSMDVLNVNITNPFIDLITGVLSNWKDEYENEMSLGTISKRHKIFQPYRLVNLTGEQIEYCTFKDTNLSSVDFKSRENNINTESELDSISSEWVVIDDKCERQFNFYQEQLNYSFRRNKDSKSTTMHSNHHYALRAHNYKLRELVQHRIRVKLDDWTEIRPLTIDKVGTYFRDIYQLKGQFSQKIRPNITRLIFDISLSGNATKLIEIKSPVSIKNRLNFKIQCRIEPCFQRKSNPLGPLIIEIDTGNEISVPIKYLPCNIWFRPLDLEMNKEAEFSTKFTNCNDINQSGQVEYYHLSCKLTNSNENFIKPVTKDLFGMANESFYFFAKIKRHNFTQRTKNSKKASSPNLSNVSGHMISIEPAFTLYNLLPLEFRYRFISSSNSGEKNSKQNQQQQSKKIENLFNGKIDSNKSNNFNNINCGNPIDLYLEIDNFRMARVIEINPSKHLTNISKAKEQSDSVDSNPQRTPNDSFSNDTANQIQSNRKLTILRRVNFYDEKNRPLFLIARIIFKIGTGLNLQNNSLNNEMDKILLNPCPIEVHISAVYCFFNLTGLPLLFRQFNCDEAAGQSEEHEMARSNQPLLFSFNETDSPYACSMRVGKLCNDFKNYIYRSKSLEKNKNIIPKWCKPFGLEGGSSYRALHVINNTVTNSKTNESHENNQVSRLKSDESVSFLHPDWVYYIGIEIKQGKGLLKDTIFVYFSTRYYLVNRSSLDLLISQYFSIQNIREQNASLSWDTNALSSQQSTNEAKNSIVLLSDSMTQFHWPRTDKDQLLSIRLKQDSNYNWSGGFKIDNVDSFQLNLRNKLNSNELLLIKTEVILDGGTFFIVFTNTYDYPPPIKLINKSEIPVYFYQSESAPETYSISVKANQTMKYSWDEPIMEKKLIVGVKGGTSELFDFHLLDDKKFLFYENFIYVVFEKTGKKSDKSKLNDHEFVLASINNKVFIDHKESGKRSQLWNLTSEGFLVHEGSSPPRDLMQNTDISKMFVLDIEDVAPQPNRFMSLTLSKPDSRRYNTQKWSFQSNGLLCCRVLNMCLQIDGELTKMARVVLGPSKNLSKNNEMITVLRQSLRPGSGNLSVEMITDGPTRLIVISNINEKSFTSINWKSEVDFKSNEKDDLQVKKTRKKTLEIYVNLTGGIGVSLVHWFKQEYEELVYGCFKSLEINFEQNNLEQKLMLNVQSIQVCNQLLNASKQNLVYILNTQNYVGDAQNSNSFSLATNHGPHQYIKKTQPALHIDFIRLFKHENFITVKHLLVRLFDVNLQVEEKLLWKIIQMMRFDKSDASGYEIHSQTPRIKIKTRTKSGSFYNSNNLAIDNEHVDSDSISLNYYKTRINSLITNSKATKYSFNKLQIDKINLTLSVCKTSRLTPDLLKIKSSLGIPLIQFENARIYLEPFILMNEHDTASCILNLIKKHFTQQFRSNAISILGSVDFLGNPLGFVVDFKESLTNVLSNGQVTDFVFAITHGFANSVSKFSGFLSDELNELTLDERHRETRDQIRNVYSNGSVDHFVGGALGFAVGVVGGALSLMTQTYRGFSENGMTGAFSGFGKGAVGTVSKPIVGVLDFTNGIASAIRETSKASYKMEAQRIRGPRCCATPGALLTPFSGSDADAQKILYKVNNFNLNEKYVSIEQLNHPTESIICIISNQRIMFIKSSEYEYTTLYEVTFHELIETNVVEENNKIFLEIFMDRDDGTAKKQRFKFENKQIANSVVNKIRFGKADYDETFYSLTNYKDDDE